MARTFGSITAGKGAVYEWNGNSNVGQGRMEITESTPVSKIAIKLDFIKPFEGHNVATFGFEPKGETTLVSWTMTGRSAYITKLMGVFFDMRATNRRASASPMLAFWWYSSPKS